ncbi:hypothetical protein LWM68_35670 [Niabella sp. W65]|nr:hypothetical protein [Niabella sp. W65]MCH7367630.1 hypothetical protein [Niabella sp. W65]ULT43427.1 hypothetical protein KRR40_08310 [Niabella sp. I65]
MKALQQTHIKIVLSVFTLFFSTVLWAQDDTKKVEVDINTKGAGESANNFLCNPGYGWLAGLSLFYCW